MTDSADSSPEKTRTKFTIWWVFFVWPVFTGAMLLFLALTTFITAELRSSSFSDALPFVAGWFNSNGHSSTFDADFALTCLALTIAITVGLAFSLPKGGVEHLPEKTQGIIFVLVVGSSLFAAMISAVTTWNILAEFAGANVIFVLIGAWLSTLILELTPLQRSPVDLHRNAEKNWKTLLAPAPTNLGLVIMPNGSSSDIRFDLAPGRKQVQVARLQFWVFPLILALFPGLVLIYDYQGLDLTNEAIGVASFTP